MTNGSYHFLDARSRLNFISGKGGVGKTSISCALALKASRAGLETLLFAVSPAHPIETFFGLPGRLDSGFHELFPRLCVQNLDHGEIFNEFIQDSLKIRKIYELILSSQVYQYFTAIAPGIKELITQEVIISALARTKRFQGRFFDLIIVDSPATGHGLSWFSVPDAVLTTFLVGPLNWKAREIKNIWLNRDLTSIHLATLPEEMPVNETVEFYHSLTDRLQYPVKSIILNSVFPGLDGDRLDPNVTLDLASLPRQGTDDRLDRVLPLIEQTARFYRSRRALNEQFRAEIIRSIPRPLIEIPMIFDKGSPLRFLEQIGEWL